MAFKSQVIREYQEKPAPAFQKKGKFNKFQKPKVDMFANNVQRTYTQAYLDNAEHYAEIARQEAAEQDRIRKEQIRKAEEAYKRGQPLGGGLREQAERLKQMTQNLKNNPPKVQQQQNRYAPPQQQQPVQSENQQSINSAVSQIKIKLEGFSDVLRVTMLLQKVLKMFSNYQNVKFKEIRLVLVVEHDPAKSVNKKLHVDANDKITVTDDQ